MLTIIHNYRNWLMLSALLWAGIWHQTGSAMESFDQSGEQCLICLTKEHYQDHSLPTIQGQELFGCRQEHSGNLYHRTCVIDHFNKTESQLTEGPHCIFCKRKMPSLLKSLLPLDRRRRKKTINQSLIASLWPNIATCYVDEQDQRTGKTPLLMAVDQENYELALALLARGAAINIPDARGRTVRTLVDQLPTAQQESFWSANSRTYRLVKKLRTGTDAVLKELLPWYTPEANRALVANNETICCATMVALAAIISPLVFDKIFTRTREERMKDLYTLEEYDIMYALPAVLITGKLLQKTAPKLFEAIQPFRKKALYAKTWAMMMVHGVKVGTILGTMLQGSEMSLPRYVMLAAGTALTLHNALSIEALHAQLEG